MSQRLFPYLNVEEFRIKYQELHELCFQNKDILKESKECVCIDCFEIINYDELEEFNYWTIDDTALCPGCCVDSLIPLHYKGRDITPEEIFVLNQIYFS